MPDTQKVIIRLADGTLKTYPAVAGIGVNEFGMITLGNVNHKPLALLNPVHVASMDFPEADNVIKTADAGAIKLVNG